MIFAVHDAQYPRHSMLRKVLTEQAAVKVVVVEQIWSLPRGRRLLNLFFRGMKQSKDCKAIFLSEFSLQYAVLGWLISKWRGIPLFVDHFVGVYETHILDHESSRPGSLRARYFQLIDFLAFKLADVATIDTHNRARDLAARYSRVNTPVYVLPVGAPDWARLATETKTLPSAHTGPLRVIFYGNYLPLHGVPYVIQSAAMIPRSADITITIIGSSPHKSELEDLGKTLGLQSVVKFKESMPVGALVAEIEQSDVVLGIFGDTAKARSVLANKVWQGLYMGRTVLTRSSDALAELQGIVGDQLIGVDINRPESLAKALVELSSNPSASRWEPRTRELDDYVFGAYRDVVELIDVPARRS
jgi:hypothetical protein